MGKKKEKPINLNELEEEEKMKYEIPGGSADW